MNENLSDIVKHNFKTLALPVTCFKGDGLNILTQLNQQFDLIYVDPSKETSNPIKFFVGKIVSLISQKK